MTKYQGFKSKEEAKQYQKKHGGILVWNDHSKKDGRFIRTGVEYSYVLQISGLKEEDFPCFLLWRGV